MEGEARLKELAHYICHRCSGSDKFGATMLNKTLWFADSLVYKQNGRSITGTRYKKLQHGPVPINITSVLEELQREGRLAVEEREYFGLRKTHFISLEEPDTSFFTEEELEFVDLLASEICENHTATSISNLSHDAVWEAASMGEEIPLNAVLAADEAPLDDDDIEWAESVIRAREAASQ